jgi:hypothetical protein
MNMQIMLVVSTAISFQSKACVGGSIPSLVSAPIVGYGKPDGTWLTGVFLTAIEHTGSSPVGAIK